VRLCCGALSSAAIQAASPLGFWWLDPATVYALSLPLIAAVTSAWRWRPAGQSSWPLRAASRRSCSARRIAVTGPAWLLVLGFNGHGLKDLWQKRRHYVANTRWWPPFCPVVDWVVAAILVVLIAAGVEFHH
jgi:hypothetical protein